MKILHIHPTLRSGGIEAIICGLVNEMVITNDVTVCTIFKPNANDVFYNKLHPRIQKISLGKINTGFSLSEIFKIANIIKQGNYDIVHIHGCFYYYALAIALFHLKTKFIYTIHSDANKENLTWDKRIFKLKKFFFKHKYMIPVTISPESQKSFENLYHCNSKMIFNGILKPQIKKETNIIDKLRISSTTKVFIHPGRITEAKNQLTLCKVFNQLIKEGEDVVLAIAGLKEDIAIFNSIEPYFCERIKYLGELNNIPDLMAHSDAFCLPSIWEGLPVTLIEALSVGCIPICSPVGGIINVITNKKNGLLSKSSQEKDYYLTIKDFLHMTQDQISLMKKQCINSFSNYDIKTIAISYLNFYSNSSI